MTNKVSVISRAFTLLGQSPINALSPDNDIHIAVSELYETELRDLLTMNPWRFALTIQELNKLSAVPPIDLWAYQYQISSIPEVMKINRVYPLSPYAIYQDKIYSNLTALKLEYIFKPESGKFPEYFTVALIYLLAAKMAILITQNANLASFFEAQSEKKIDSALAIDAQQMPNIVIPTGELYGAHFG